MKIEHRSKCVLLKLTKQDADSLRELLEIVERERASNPVSWLRWRSKVTHKLFVTLCGVVHAIRGWGPLVAEDVRLAPEYRAGRYAALDWNGRKRLEERETEGEVD